MGSGNERGVRKIGTSLRAVAILLYRSSRVKKIPWANFSNLVSSMASAASRACSRRILTGAASESSDVAYCFSWLYWSSNACFARSFAAWVAPCSSFWGLMLKRLDLGEATILVWYLIEQRESAVEKQ